ncbi:phosphoribosyltransferase [Trueperella sp. LYQ141]|uniref:phosphoribosyltransferase n=1 Tax=Trueperella sp. LYQ141 TaxID=3391058 RepID=UPI003982F331
MEHPALGDTSTPSRETLDWPTFGQAMRELAQTVITSGWIPDFVVAIARGGLLPAGAIAYAMGIKAIGTMNVEFYTDIAQTLPEPVLLPPLMDVSSLAGQGVLVVDDVADSGKTLQLVMDLISTRGLSLDGQQCIPVDARCAVIYEKSRSIIKPDYTWRHTDLWINFPWSTLPPIER